MITLYLSKQVLGTAVPEYSLTATGVAAHSQVLSWIWDCKLASGRRLLLILFMNKLFICIVLATWTNIPINAVWTVCCCMCPDVLPTSRSITSPQLVWQTRSANHSSSYHMTPFLNKRFGLFKTLGTSQQQWAVIKYWINNFWQVMLIQGIQLKKVLWGHRGDLLCLMWYVKGKIKSNQRRPEQLKTLKG